MNSSDGFFHSAANGRLGRRVCKVPGDVAYAPQTPLSNDEQFSFYHGMFCKAEGPWSTSSISGSPPSPEKSEL